jgi:hypothetical protein
MGLVNSFVQDLGKAIAKYVIVFNCSDGLDYKSMGRMFSGLAQTGAWSWYRYSTPTQYKTYPATYFFLFAALMNSIGQRDYSCKSNYF